MFTIDDSPFNINIFIQTVIKNCFEKIRSENHFNVKHTFNLLQLTSACNETTRFTIASHDVLRNQVLNLGKNLLLTSWWRPGVKSITGGVADAWLLWSGSLAVARLNVTKWLFPHVNAWFLSTIVFLNRFRCRRCCVCAEETRRLSPVRTRCLEASQVLLCRRVKTWNLGGPKT